MFLFVLPPLSWTKSTILPSSSASAFPSSQASSPPCTFTSPFSSLLHHSCHPYRPPFHHFLQDLSPSAVRSESVREKVVHKARQKVDETMKQWMDGRVNKLVTAKIKEEMKPKLKRSSSKNEWKSAPTNETVQQEVSRKMMRTRWASKWCSGVRGQKLDLKQNGERDNLFFADLCIGHFGIFCCL